jgi:hypothetical protein
MKVELIPPQPVDEDVQITITKTEAGYLARILANCTAGSDSPYKSLATRLEASLISVGVAFNKHPEYDSYTPSSPLRFHRVKP